MIMAKFSALAKIQSSSVAQDGAETAIKPLECSSVLGEPAKGTCDEDSVASMREAGTGLSEEQLLEVFKQTSIFNVRTALAGNEALWEIDDMMEMAAERYGEDEELSDDDDWMRSFWSVDENREDRKPSKESRKSAGSSRGCSMRVLRGGGSNRQRQTIVTAYNPQTQALVRRRVRWRDPDDILMIRIPNPLPLAWGRTVRPFDPSLSSLGPYSWPVPRPIVPVEEILGQDVGHETLATALASRSAPATGLEQEEGVLPKAAPLPEAVARDLEASSDSAQEVDAPHHPPAPAETPAPPTHLAPCPSDALAEDSSLKPLPLPPGRLCCVPDVLTADIAELGSPAAFQAVVVQLGWEGSGDDDPAARLKALTLPPLVPSGFVFIFVPKHLVQVVFKQAASWGLVYVENLTWVFRAPDHSILRLPAHYAALSHLSLYMFRSTDRSRDLDLRHQRSPDVVFDCRTSAQVPGSPFAMPEAVYATIETLLPGFVGRCIELWAPRLVVRPGWFHVAQGDRVLGRVEDNC